MIIQDNIGVRLYVGEIGCVCRAAHRPSVVMCRQDVTRAERLLAAQIQREEVVLVLKEGASRMSMQS